jgi:hypothetical protein
VVGLCAEFIFITGAVVAVIAAILVIRVRLHEVFFRAALWGALAWLALWGIIWLVWLSGSAHAAGDHDLAIKSALIAAAPLVVVLVARIFYGRRGIGRD